jgi:hypothetical protein
MDIAAINTMSHRVPFVSGIASVWTMCIVTNNITMFTYAPSHVKTIHIINRDWR